MIWSVMTPVSQPEICPTPSSVVNRSDHNRHRLAHLVEPDAVELPSRPEFSLLTHLPLMVRRTVVGPDTAGQNSYAVFRCRPGSRPRTDRADISLYSQRQRRRFEGQRGRGEIVYAA